MSATETTPAPPSTPDDVDADRERSFRLVLIGLVVLIAGFTAALLANGLYPCVPGASGIEPPLSDCAISLSPWAGVGIVGLAIALVGYRRAG